MLKMVLASGNRDKYLEMREVLGRIGVELIYGGDFANPPEVEETGDTYEENALLKAQAWMEFTGLPALADDSGIEIDALGGAPGVRSARIVPGKDSDRTRWLLEQMRDKIDRSARFVACLVVVFPGSQKIIISEKSCAGRLTYRPIGASGFGYDPIFIPDGYLKTFSELGVSEKLKISHRALALKDIAEMLQPVIQSFTAV